MKTSNRSTVCPICRSTDCAAPHWRRPCFLRCRRCGAIFRDPFPTDSELGALYRSSWTDSEAHSDETGGTDRELGHRLSAALLRELGRCDFSGQRILDFGAGRGGMSAALRDRRADVVAVEPFGDAGLRHLGIPVYRDLGEVPAELQFDGIVAIEVAEHLRDPCGALRQLADALRHGGWLLLTTPNPLGLAALLRGRRWRSALNAGHILFFPAPTLHRALCELGFVKVRRTRWIIRFPDASPPHAIVQSVLQWLQLGGGLRFLAVKG